MFQKVKTEHTIMKEFHAFLLEIEKIDAIQRIIPGRIARQQSGRAELRINFSYATITGLKYKMCKGSTAQELFVIVEQGSAESVKNAIHSIVEHYK